MDHGTTHLLKTAVLMLDMTKLIHHTGKVITGIVVLVNHGVYGQAFIKKGVVTGPRAYWDMKLTIIVRQRIGQDHDSHAIDQR